MKVKTRLRAGARDCHLTDPVKGTTICCEDVPESCFAPLAG